VTLTGKDIAKLSQFLGLQSNELLRAVDFYTITNGKAPPVGLRNTPQVKTERGMAYIALKKLEMGQCIFLKDDLCMIHPFRPSACEAFPFVFDRNEDSIMWGLSAMKDICPGLGKGSEIRISDLENLGLSIVEDLQIFREFVEEWNLLKENPTAQLLLDSILEDSRFFV
jgi:Fe-S-cluster containining protein